MPGESKENPTILIVGVCQCNGQIITKNTIDLAEGFYKNMQAKCDLKTPEGRQMAAIYQVGLEGINRIRKAKK